MPELPDIELYRFALGERILGEPLLDIRIVTPFVLRTVSPSPRDLVGKKVVGLRRIGKRIAIELEDRYFIVIHLMIAGRLRWCGLQEKLPGGKIISAVLSFPTGTLALTEAGTKKRASISILAGEEALKSQDPGGIEVQQASLEEFTKALMKESHTLKTRLADPHVFSGIGNAYSDEILFRAKLSPLKLTNRLDPEEVRRLYEAVRTVLNDWTARLQAQFAGRFPGPGEVTAFRPDFAVHGKYDSNCPVCRGKVARIRYSENECNYCPQCQTGGKLLADRAMSRLLR